MFLNVPPSRDDVALAIEWQAIAKRLRATLTADGRTELTRAGHTSDFVRMDDTLLSLYAELETAGLETAETSHPIDGAAVSVMVRSVWRREGPGYLQWTIPWPMQGENRKQAAAMSYARRYLLYLCLGIPTDGLDGDSLPPAEVAGNTAAEEAVADLDFGDDDPAGHDYAAVQEASATQPVADEPADTPEPAETPAEAPETPVQGKPEPTPEPPDDDLDFGSDAISDLDFDVDVAD